jgi:hypothetical protein
MKTLNSPLTEDILEALREFPDGLTSKEIADLVVREYVSISPCLAPMEREGLIRRSGDKRKNSESGTPATIWVLN